MLCGSDQDIPAGRHAARIKKFARRSLCLSWRELALDWPLPFSRLALLPNRMTIDHVDRSFCQQRCRPPIPASSSQPPAVLLWSYSCFSTGPIHYALLALARQPSNAALPQRTTTRRQPTPSRSAHIDIVDLADEIFVSPARSREEQRSCWQ